MTRVRQQLTVTCPWGEWWLLLKSPLRKFSMEQAPFWAVT